MIERPPNTADNNNEKISLQKEFMALGKELSENQEGFPFPGIDPIYYSKIKATEEEFPGYMTPIDTQVERFKNEGMKIVLGTNPRSFEVYILPLQSNNIEEDSIFPHHLQTDEGLNDKLKKLILLGKNLQ